MGKIDDWLKEKPKKKRESIADWLQSNAGKKREYTADWLKGNSGKKRRGLFDWLNDEARKPPEPPKPPEPSRPSKSHSITWTGPGPEPDPDELRARTASGQRFDQYVLIVGAVFFVVLLVGLANGKPGQSLVTALVAALSTGVFLFGITWLIQLLTQLFQWLRSNTKASVVGGICLLGGGAWLASTPTTHPYTCPEYSQYALQPYQDPAQLPAGSPTRFLPPSSSYAAQEAEETQALLHESRTFDACVGVLVPEPVGKYKRWLVKEYQYNLEDAEDISANALIRACSYFVNRGNRAAAELPKLYAKTLKTAAIDYHRERQRPYRCSSLPPDCWINPGVVAEDGREELLQAALCNLQEPHQTIVRLRMDGFRNAAIAADLGLSPRQVDDYYSNGVKKLRLNIQRMRCN